MDTFISTKYLVYVFAIRINDQSFNLAHHTSGREKGKGSRIKLLHQ